MAGFLAGKNASVKIGAVSLRFREWRLPIKTDIIDTSNFESQGFRENIAGLQAASVTVRGLHDSAAMPFTSGELYTLELHSSALVMYTVPARLETLETGTDVEGAVEAVLTFQSCGVFVPSIA